MYLFAEQPSHTQYPNQTHIPIVHNIPLCRDEIEKKSKSTLMFLNILNHLPIKHKRQKKLFNLSFKGVEDLVYRFYCKVSAFWGCKWHLLNKQYNHSHYFFFFRFVWEKGVLPRINSSAVVVVCIHTRFLYTYSNIHSLHPLKILSQSNKSYWFIKCSWQIWINFQQIFVPYAIIQYGLSVIYL